MSLWRIDDICLNTNMQNVSELVRVIKERDKDARVALTVSVTCPNTRDADEMAFLRQWKPLSDNTVFYSMGRCGVPDVAALRDNGCAVWSHGLVHADHRLLHYYAQELSIVLSCSILNTETFVPPFHHWNDDTRAVCESHGLSLVKYEDGWSGSEHTDYDSSIAQWYLHPWRWDAKKLEAWFNG